MTVITDSERFGHEFGVAVLAGHAELVAGSLAPWLADTAVQGIAHRSEEQWSCTAVRTVLEYAEVVADADFGRSLPAEVRPDNFRAWVALDFEGEGPDGPAVTWWLAVVEHGGRLAVGHLEVEELP